MITTERVELPEGNIAIVQDSYKYLGFPEANGNNEEAGSKLATAKYLHRVREVLRSQLNGQMTMNGQDPSNQHLCAARHQIPSCNNNLAKGGYRSRRYQDKEAPHHAWRVSLQVQHPDVLH